MNRISITEMEQVLCNEYGNTGGILVQKDGHLIYEKYLNGCNQNSYFHIFSVTKSIISLLFGIATDKGFLQGIDQKILNFFPEYRVKGDKTVLQKITIRDMLTMTVPYQYETEPMEEYFGSDDWVRAALDLMGGSGQIGEFRYAPLIGPDILSAILKRVTGESVFNFTAENLFAPLGIHVDGNVVFQNKEEQLAWYGRKDTQGWVASRQGVNTAGWGLSLTTLDMGRIGQLCINKGMWNGRQIVSKPWMEESTRAQSYCTQWNLSYGYLWWVLDDREHIYAAMGDGGNIIYINEGKKLTVAISALWEPAAKDRIELIRSYVEPLFV